ncbi:hypothetical protein C8R44DRAFT_726724 [Mycena epipterygia]|nr:hypothetical protein C8R44DRAFT_726724 [Mycena epipterygia]
MRRQGRPRMRTLAMGCVMLGYGDKPPSARVPVATPNFSPGSEFCASIRACSISATGRRVGRRLPELKATGHVWSLATYTMKPSYYHRPAPRKHLDCSSQDYNARKKCRWRTQMYIYIVLLRLQDPVAALYDVHLSAHPLPARYYLPPNTPPSILRAGFLRLWTGCIGSKLHCARFEPVISGRANPSTRAADFIGPPQKLVRAIQMRKLSVLGGVLDASLSGELGTAAYESVVVDLLAALQRVSAAPLGPHLCSDPIPVSFDGALPVFVYTRAIGSSTCKWSILRLQRYYPLRPSGFMVAASACTGEAYCGILGMHTERAKPMVIGYLVANLEQREGGIRAGMHIHRLLPNTPPSALNSRRILPSRRIATSQEVAEPELDSPSRHANSRYCVLVGRTTKPSDSEEQAEVSQGFHFLNNIIPARSDFLVTSPLSLGNLASKGEDLLAPTHRLMDTLGGELDWQKEVLMPSSRIRCRSFNATLLSQDTESEATWGRLHSSRRDWAATLLEMQRDTGDVILEPCPPGTCAISLLHDQDLSVAASLHQQALYVVPPDAGIVFSAESKCRVKGSVYVRPSLYISMAMGATGVGGLKGKNWGAAGMKKDTSSLTMRRWACVMEKLGPTETAGLRLGV